ncbi:MAG TPA: phosphatase PAP2 family protein [Arenimonas sp.]|uniref:phosphatase PAP2 family protein n=1 Tax=Arenimonas sp. TaxID=1872635 RepID=UPI002D7F823F|nr:phosphatase PAP2 family protein [Arenimonas sp.]HEU0154411.1 phosphatase PAP2 family protein [Arenimonas sp.]
MPAPPVRPWAAWAIAFLLLPVLALCLVHAGGLDPWLAGLMFDPASPMAETIRESSPLVTWGVAAALLLANLAVVLVPGWRRHRGPVRTVSLQWLMLLLLSLVVLSEGLGKQYFDRARPRETIALGGAMPYQPMFTAGQAFDGQSQMSSHAVAALACAGLYFFLFPVRRRLARVVLVVGLAFSAWVGIGRMVSGAHYLSDVLLSFLLTMAAAMAIAWVAARFDARGRAAAVALALLLVAWTWGVVGAAQVRQWRALDQALAAAAGEATGTPGLVALQRQQARLRRQGWLLRTAGVSPDEASGEAPGVAGLRDALAALPAGTAFQLALVDLPPFDATGYGAIRVACEAARITAIDPQAAFAAAGASSTTATEAAMGQPTGAMAEEATSEALPAYRVYRGMAGASGRCPGLPFAYLDSPRAYQVVDGTLGVSGWAVDAGSEIASIEILLDGRPLGPIAFGVRPLEPDASFARLAVPLARIAPFKHRLALDDAPAGWHTLSLRTTNASGITTLTPPTLVRITY